MSGARFDFDCAIVGAGVAGSYCHYRLSQAGWKTALFEATDRIGGRLWSLPRRDSAAPAELGGHTFSSAHASIAGLADLFGLKKRPVHFSLGARLLRGRTIGIESEPRDLPYVLRAREEGKGAGQLLTEAIAQIAPETEQYLSNTSRSNRRALAKYLRAVRVDGRSLSQWSFWPLLTRVLSHEAIALSRACFGSAAAVGDVNAYDAIWVLLAECAPQQRHYCFADGFDALPKALAAHAGAPVLLGHRLGGLAKAGEGVRLDFETPDGAIEVRARYAILALPQRALRSLNVARFADAATLAADLDTVSPVSACKLFLTYDKAWWSSQSHRGAGLRIVASFTDQPLRQTYAFAPDAREVGALMMALYADDAEARYWQALSLGGPAADCGAFAGAEISLRPTKQLLDAAQAQLEALHPGAAMHAPTCAAFVDWGESRGGAWHAFKPGVESWRVRQRLRRPDPQLPLFICGEAFAELQGWSEGALNNAEMMLERYFGVGRPHWVDPHYPFEIEGVEDE